MPLARRNEGDAAVAPMLFADRIGTSATPASLEKCTRTTRHFSGRRLNARTGFACLREHGARQSGNHFFRRFSMAGIACNDAGLCFTGRPVFAY